MAYTPNLPPPKKYRDLPIREDNRVDTAVRILNAAWNALHSRDAEDIALRDLAVEVGVSQPAAYNHFRDKQALFGEVAREALTTLIRELMVHLPEDAPDLTGRMKAVTEAWLGFAAARPRHYVLMYSLEFNDPKAFPAVAVRREHLEKLFTVITQHELGFTAAPAQGHMVLAMLHGAASLIASGGAKLPVAVVHGAIESHLAALRKKRK